MNVATQDEGAILERLENYLGGEEGEPREEAVAEEVTEAEEVSESEETEEVSDDADDSEVESKDAADEEGEALELSDLAEYLKLDAEKLDLDEEGNLYIKTKVDGEEGRATLNDLIKSYQLEGHLNKQNMEVQSLKKELETKRAELEQQSQQRLSQLESLSQLAWQELNQEYQSIDWQTLRQEDPAEFAAKAHEFQQREARLQRAFQQIHTEKQQSQVQDQGRIQEILQQESKRLLDAIPEWQDQKVADQERADLRKFAIGLGFSEQEIGSVIDHRQVMILRDAMKYRQLQENKPSVTNRVKKAPKLTKPGAPKSQKATNERKLGELKKSIKKTGGKQGVVEYLLSTGKA